MRDGAQQPTVIRTPDYRLRVFVSSTLNELAEERDAVRQAILRLRLAPVLFELGARPHPPAELYKAYLAQSHIFVGIYWQSYGWMVPGKQISGLEDEYDLSASLPRLLYIKNAVLDRDPRLAKLLDRIRNENAGCYKPFDTADELMALVENDLALMLTERFEAARGESAQQERAVQHPLTNVPFPRNSLIGRERELRIGCDMLLREDVALVTLTGPGGSGKSRLGIQIALELRDRFADGVYLVGLEAISDPDLVIPAIAKTLGVVETNEGSGLVEGLKAYLHKKQVLLFLDNLEQVLSAAPRIANLLEVCPQTKILVTSRAPLHLRAEKELPVPPLALPPLRQAHTAKPLSQYAAVQLFIQRAQAVKPDFAVNNENAPAVAEICHRLDGLPLAIELASARIRMLSPQALLERLKASLELLRGGGRDLPERQKTLRSAINWSYNLLSEEEKQLLRRLSVFVGGWTFEAAEDVCNAGAKRRIDIFTGLEQLVDFSLIVSPQEVAGELRFKILETIREFSMHRLMESGEADEVRQAHGQYFLRLAEEAEPHLKGAQQTMWGQRLEREYENLRGALAWALGSGRGEEGLRLAVALGNFWMIHGHFAEGREWVRQALEIGKQAPKEVRIKALRCAGILAQSQGDYPWAKQAYEESLVISQQLKDKQGIAYALNNLGSLALDQGEYAEGKRILEESLVICRELGDMRSMANTLNNLGNVAMYQERSAEAKQLFEECLLISRKLGDKQSVAFAMCNLGILVLDKGEFALAKQLFEECLAICREVGHKRGAATALSNLGSLALDQGEHAEAKRVLEESLVICRELGDKWGMKNVLSGLASVLAVEGHGARAARLQGAVVLLSQEIGAPLEPLEQAIYQKTAASLKAALGEEGYRQAFEAGQQLALEEAILLAMDWPEGC